MRSLFFVLFVFRVLLRWERLAFAAFVVVVGALTMNYPVTSWAEVPFAVFNALVWGAVLLRFGLVVAMVADAVLAILRAIPLTLDLSAWYAGAAAVPLLLIVLLALYGFRTSLGKRKLIRLPD